MSRRPHAGFTLIELLFSLAVLAVLIGIGAPSMRSFLDDGQVSTAATDLMSDIYLARSTALKLNCDVTMTPKTASSTTSWANGWTITYLSASATDLACSSGAGSVTTTIKDRSSLSPNVTIGGTSAAFTYGYDGKVSTAPTIPINASKDNSTANERCLSISLIGKPVVRALARNATC